MGRAGRVWHSAIPTSILPCLKTAPDSSTNLAPNYPRALSPHLTRPPNSPASPILIDSTPSPGTPAGFAGLSSSHPKLLPPSPDNP